MDEEIRVGEQNKGPEQGREWGQVFVRLLSVQGSVEVADSEGFPLRRAHAVNQNCGVRSSGRQQAHMACGASSLRETAVGGDQGTVEHLGKRDVSGVVVGDSAERGELEGGVCAGHRERYDFQRDREEVSHSASRASSSGGRERPKRRMFPTSQ